MSSKDEDLQSAHLTLNFPGVILPHGRLQYTKNLCSATQPNKNDGHEHILVAVPDRNQEKVLLWSVSEQF